MRTVKPGRKRLLLPYQEEIGDRSTRGVLAVTNKV
jgi:hypothetical protein